LDFVISSGKASAGEPMTDESNVLELCPFCGSQVHADNVCELPMHAGTESAYAVICNCGASGPKENLRQKAIDAWDTRAKAVSGLSWNPFRFSADLVSTGNGVKLRGNLDSFSLASILQTVSSESKTGIMQFTSGRTKTALCFKEGKIIAAHSNAGAQLGELLLGKGMISRDNLQHALDTAKKAQIPIGESLLHLGYIRQNVLKEVIHHQVRQIVLDLFLWEQGTFEFYDCRVSFDQKGIKDINLLNLALDGARLVDERMHPSVAVSR